MSAAPLSASQDLGPARLEVLEGSLRVHGWGVPVVSLPLQGIQRVEFSGSEGRALLVVSGDGFSPLRFSISLDEARTWTPWLLQVARSNNLSTKTSSLEVAPVEQAPVAVALSSNPWANEGSSEERVSERDSFAGSPFGVGVLLLSAVVIIAVPLAALLLFGSWVSTVPLFPGDPDSGPFLSQERRFIFGALTMAFFAAVSAVLVVAGWNKAAAVFFVPTFLLLLVNGPWAYPSQPAAPEESSAPLGPNPWAGTDSSLGIFALVLYLGLLLAAVALFSLLLRAVERADEPIRR